MEGGKKRGVYEIPMAPPTKLRELVVRVRLVPLAGEALGFGDLGRCHCRFKQRQFVTNTCDVQTRKFDRFF